MTNGDGFRGRMRRNGRAAVGVAGLAAVIGGGAFLITDHLTEKPASNADLAVQKTPAAPSAAASSNFAPTTAAEEKRVVVGPLQPVASRSASLDERVDSARSANKRLGTGVRRPIPTPTITVDEAKVKVAQTGTPQQRRYIKVASSNQDLTGYRELAWVRNGKPVGDATCTKSITLSADESPRERPTLLICWKTSVAKSVYTVAVDFDKPPAEAASVAELDKTWAAMR
jgi:hypothetical protein